MPSTKTDIMTFLCMNQRHKYGPEAQVLCFVIVCADGKRPLTDGESTGRRDVGRQLPEGQVRRGKRVKLLFEPH